MAKPADTMEWASDGAAQITEPLEAKKDIGWVVGEKPPAQYFNWWMNNAYLWQAYFDEQIDILLGGVSSLSSTTDITITFDSDNNATTNATIFKHNAGTEVARIDESSNLLLNLATAGTNGVGLIGLKNGTSPTTNVTDVSQIYTADFAAGDSRLNILTEQGGAISIGNNAIRNVNTDGTLIVASEKHITADIDSDNDGTDGLFTVRANGTTAAMTVTEAGLVTATGNVIGTNISATNLTDITNLRLAMERSAFLNFHRSTDTIIANVHSITGSALNTIAVGNPISVGGTIVMASDSAAVDILQAQYGDVDNFAANPLAGSASTVVATDGAYYVRATTAGEIYSATDPDDTWTAATVTPSLLQVGNLFFGGGYWVAGGEIGIAVKATIPTGTWAAPSSIPGSTSWYSPAVINGARPRGIYGNGYWVMVANSTAGLITVATTPTGTWTNYTITGMQVIHDLTFDGTRFIAVGGVVGNIEIYYATNPTGAWTASLDSTSPTYISATGWATSIIYTGLQYIVYGTLGKTVPVSWISTDLVTWTMYPCQVSNKSTTNDLPATNASLQALYCNWGLPKRVYMIDAHAGNALFISNAF